MIKVPRDCTEGLRMFSLEPSDNGVDGVARDFDRSSWKDVNTNNNGVREFPRHVLRTEANG